MNDKQSESNQPSESSPGFSAVVLSTLAAAVGVQSGRNQARDFSRGKVAHYIVAGVVFTLLFIVTLVIVVRTVLSNSAL